MASSSLIDIFLRDETAKRLFAVTAPIDRIEYVASWNALNEGIAKVADIKGGILNLLEFSERLAYVAALPAGGDDPIARPIMALALAMQGRHSSGLGKGGIIASLGGWLSQPEIDYAQRAASNMHEKALEQAEGTRRMGFAEFAKQAGSTSGAALGAAPPSSARPRR